MPAHKSGKKGRKIGRAARRPSTKRYKADDRSELNKIKKLERHIKAHPEDKQATDKDYKPVFPKIVKKEKEKRFIPGVFRSTVRKFLGTV